jgi:hypothetical protein
MLLPVEEIASRLSKAGLPTEYVERHVTKVAAWRKSHIKVKRKLLYEFVINASGHRIAFKNQSRCEIVGTRRTSHKREL